MNDSENERYSVCIVHADHHGQKTYYKYFRVADFIPQESSDELIPALVQEHATSLEEGKPIRTTSTIPLLLTITNHVIPTFIFSSGEGILMTLASS